MFDHIVHCNCFSYLCNMSSRVYLQYIQHIFQHIFKNIPNLTIHISHKTRGRNNSKISGSPHIYVVVIWPRFKQNNTTNTQFEKYSHILWQSLRLLLSSSLVVRPRFWQSSDYRTTTISTPAQSLPYLFSLFQYTLYNKKQTTSSKYV